jgi:hypothetical protein
LVKGLYTKNKASQESTAYQYDQIGGKECHDEPERILKLVSQDQKLNPKYEKEATYQNQNDLPYPPENTRHAILTLPFLRF